MTDLYSDGDPHAVAVWAVTRRLQAITAGRSSESPAPLIREGQRLTKAAPAPEDWADWAIRAAAQAAFLSAASAFRANLLPAATAAQQQLASENVRIR